MNASMRTDRVGPKVADRYLGAERRDRPREPGLATLPQFAAAPNRDAIRFAFGECSLGLILVAATAKGICAIWFGEDRNALARELQTCFPQAKQVGDNKDSRFHHSRVRSADRRPDLGNCCRCVVFIKLPSLPGTIATNSGKVGT